MAKDKNFSFQNLIKPQPTPPTVDPRKEEEPKPSQRIEEPLPPAPASIPATPIVKTSIKEKPFKAPSSKTPNIPPVCARVPEDFKYQVSIFCAENSMTERDLIYESVSKVIGYNKEARGFKRTNFLDFKTNAKMPFIKGYYDSDFKRTLTIYCKKNKYNESNVVFQAVADTINYK